MLDIWTYYCYKLVLQGMRLLSFQKGVCFSFLFKAVCFSLWCIKVTESLVTGAVLVLGFVCTHFLWLRLRPDQNLLNNDVFFIAGLVSLFCTSFHWLVMYLILSVGQYQDLVIPVTNFQNEDRGFMVLAGDVFDVPVRKDIIHHVVRWQLAKRQQVLL